MISDKIYFIKNKNGSYGFNYSYPQGYFSACDTYYGHSCREVFASYFKSTTQYILFSQTNKNIERINKFFEEIETKLNIKEKTVFLQSDIKNTIAIKVSKFWKENSFKRGMFTLFLRCAAVHYDGEDIYEALTAYPLSKKAIGPIEWFMKGNTVINKNILSRVDGRRVVAMLSKLSKKDWQELLVEK